MPSYKLTYYNGRGLGELVRLTFVAAGVTYEDKRVNKTEWEKLKDGEYISILHSQLKSIICGTNSANVF